MSKNYFVYILTNKKRGTLYIGITSDLIGRVWRHKNKVFDGFSSKYNLNKLVYYDQSISAEIAIRREKQLKNWHRQWKINLIERDNPEWDDMYNDLVRQ